MNIIFKILIFTIMVNFAIGIMALAIPGFGDQTEDRMGLSFSKNYTETIVGDLNESINPTFQVEDSDDAFSRLLDSIGLGIVTKFLNMVNNFFFGIIDLILRPIFAPMMEQTLANFVFGILKGILTLGYIFGAIWLFTGKKILG